MKIHTLLRGLAIPVVAGGLVAAAIFSGLFEGSVVGNDSDKPLDPEQMKSLVERGAYVAVAADCYACHTAKGGAPWAGGLPLATPFGTIYSTNISPDKDKGIGNWTRAEFHRAVRDGRGKGGSHLYPAMPYTSYRKMTPEDVDAVYAYLMSREPMPVANHENELRFPFNIRQSLAFWNLLNLDETTDLRVEGKSDSWNRGRYLTDALAHCGECHTPRDLLQAMRSNKYLQGAMLEGLMAPDITKESLTRMGFNAPVLSEFMKSGVSAQGAMAHQMFEVVHFSTQYMTDQDMDALSAYLFDLDQAEERSTPPPPKPVAVSAAVETSARATYANLCAACHGANGEGIPHVVVPLSSNASLRLADAHNLVHAILNGIPAQKFPGLERMEPMPSFKDQLSDQQIADLANWMRAVWGGREPTFEPSKVTALRASP